MTSVLAKRDVVIETGDNDALKGVKRYQLVLPNALYARVQQAAEDQDVTVVQLLRAYIKLGLMVSEAEKQPGTELILRTQDGEKQLVLV